MEKIKNEATVGLHHVPFTIMWVSVAAVAFSLLLVGVIVADGLADNFQFVDKIINWFSHERQLSGILIGIAVGVIAAIGQTWLLRQCYGSAPRYWRLMTILGWGWAGHGMMILIDYQLSRDFGVYGVFAWFFVPVIFQMIALWSYVRGAWMYALAGTVAAFVSVVALNIAPRYYDAGVYGLVFGTLAHTLLTAIVIIALMARQRKVNLR